MKKVLFSLSFAIILMPAMAIDNEWMYLVTNDQFGVITKKTSYEVLVALFGKENLVEETHTGPEGEGILKCTIAFKDTRLEMAIYWDSENWHTKISSVACTQPDSPYYTKEKLQMKSTLKELVRINKAYISFSAFGWDYGGTIVSYNKGRLQSSKVVFTLEWEGKDDTNLLGDHSLNSKMPEVVKRATQIYIAKMEVFFS